MPYIDSYRFKKIVIDGQAYKKDVIIHPREGVIDPWWRDASHNVLVEDLTEYISDFPQKLIIGIGKYGMMKVPEETKVWLTEHNVELTMTKTDKACEIYNQSDKMITGAALHLTC